MQGENKQPVSSKRKTTLTEVKGEPEKKSNRAGTAEKTLPSSAEKKQKKNMAKEGTKEDKETVSFPVDSRINAYGFIFLKIKWLRALGWHKDTALKIERNPDGSITVRKA